MLPVSSGSCGEGVGVVVTVGTGVIVPINVGVDVGVAVEVGKGLTVVVGIAVVAGVTVGVGLTVMFGSGLIDTEGEGKRLLSEELLLSPPHAVSSTVILKMLNIPGLVIIVPFVYKI